MNEELKERLVEFKESKPQSSATDDYAQKRVDNKYDDILEAVDENEGKELYTILEDMMSDDYYNYIHRGYSALDEDIWEEILSIVGEYVVEGEE